MAIKFPKKQEQRLIPKYLLEYAEELQENHPDPTAEWGGGGGSPIEAGEGIVITGDETKTISVDTETIPTVAELSTVAFSGSYSDLSNKPDLSVYELKEDAFSGDYNDLTNKPDIPTKTSDLTNDSGFITSSDIPTNYVTTNTRQTITGVKTFSASGNYPITVQGDYGIHLAHNNNHAFLSPMEFKINGGFGSYDALAVHTSDITNYDYSHNSSSQLYFPAITTENANVIYMLPGETGTLALTSDIITSYNDLTDKPTIPTATSQLTNDSGYITNSALIGYATERWVLNKGYITGITSSDVTTALGYTPGTSNFSGDYDDLTNKPTIPTATSQLTNDSGFITSAALTSYVTTTQLEDALDDYALKTDIPENVSDLTNDAGYTTQTWVENQGYITGITSSDVTTALGYTPGTSNFSGDYDDLTNKPSIPTVPTNVSAFANDAGYITSSDLPTNHVTTNTAQNITGAKTFLGVDVLKLQGPASSSKPGFAINDSDGTKRGFLELRPASGDQTMVLGVTNGVSGKLDFRPGFREYNNSSYYSYSTLMPLGSDKYGTFGSGNMNMVLGVNGVTAGADGNIVQATETLTFTYSDNTTATFTFVKV